MTKVKRVKYTLNPTRAKTLPFDEIKAILRGADELIAIGGRSLLSKILKGSKDKKIKELELDKTPVYGYFKDLTIDEILQKIDWLIANGYLKIEYFYRLPLLVYTQIGWEIEKETYSEELLQHLNEMLKSGASHFNMSFLKDKNRQIIFLLLDKIKKSGKKEYIPLLQDWKNTECKRVRERISDVLDFLNKI